MSLPKKIIFKHQSDTFMLFRGKPAMLLKVENDQMVLIDCYGTMPEPEKLQSLLKVLYKSYLFRD